MSLLLILLACSIVYVENIGLKIKFNNTEDRQILLNSFKSMGANSLFSLILLNMPIYLLWQYMRKNDFLSESVFNNFIIFNYIGIEKLLVFAFISAILLIPFLKRWFKRDIAAFVMSCFVSLIIWIITILMLYFSLETTYPAIYFLFIIGCYMACRIFWYKTWWSVLVPSVLLLIMPFIVPAHNFTANILRDTNMGNLYVKIHTSNNILEGCLLLKTVNSYYVKLNSSSEKNNTIAIVNSEGTTLIYEVDNKKHCAVAKN